MIQILTYSGTESELKGEGVVVNRLHDAQSLDEFEINIISLKDRGLWKSASTGHDTIDCINDLKSISAMIKGCQKAEIVIFLPTNLYFIYNKSVVNERYLNKTELKDMTRQMTDKILCNLFGGFKSIDIVYENTNTRICGKDIKASFYFNTISNVLLTSNKSEKATAIKYDGITISTLDLITHNDVINFLSSIHLIHEKESEPEWIGEIMMFDDTEQFGIIEQNNEIIREANEAISAATNAINRNKRYKSVLYATGEDLVEIVFEILTEMIGCDLSGFKDNKKEDFLFEINGHVYIGEIKGVNHNVKNENVSQLDVHYQSYKDDHPDVKDEDISALLVINHQKSKPIAMREPIHINQINLAKRNGSLIIETMTLLQLFEKYKKQEVGRDECINILKGSTGLLSI